MDAAQAIGELMELSSQITAAIALGEDGSVLASSTDDQAAVASLSSSTVDLVLAAPPAEPVLGRARTGPDPARGGSFDDRGGA